MDRDQSNAAHEAFSLAAGTTTVIKELRSRGIAHLIDTTQIYHLGQRKGGKERNASLKSTGNWLHFW